MRARPLRFDLKETSPADKRLFKDFYKLVAECLGMTNIVIGDHDRVILHKENLEVAFLIY
jgi:phosphotransferase system IIB component